MTDILENDPLDKFFRDSIESSEARPSEQFWTKAYEGIIVREARSNKRRIAAWRSAAILLGLFIVGLVSYSVYISGKVNGLRNEVTNIEKLQSNSASNTNNNIAVNNNNAAASNTALPSTKADENKGNNLVTQDVAVNKAPSIAHATVSHNHNNWVRNNSTNPVNHSVSRTVANNQTGNSTVPTVEVSQNTGNFAGVTSKNLPPLKNDDNPVTSSLLPFPNVSFPEVARSTQSMIPDSASFNEQNPAEKAKSYFVDKMLPNVSISVFGSSNNNALTTMNGYNPEEAINASQLGANEHQQSAFSAGFNIGYDLSQRFTFQAGMNYQQYQYSIAPTQLNVHGNDLIGYPLETSSGTIDLPTLNHNIGTVTAQGNAMRSYVCIPVQLKWNFLVDKKFKLYATAGGAANILAVNSASISWENAYGSESIKTKDIAGTNIVTCSYLVGLGAEYKLPKGFSAYVEGTYLGALVPVSSASFITVKSNLISEAVGIKYHL